jgi:thiol:disulfide interchange protein
MGRIISFLFLSVALGLYGAPVKAPHITAELLASASSVRSGSTLLIGVKLQIEKGWHVYWRNPGDSGDALSVRWTAPEGSIPSPLLWPAPHRIPVPPLLNFGYEDEVTVLTEVLVGKQPPGATRFKVQAAVSWLVCQEICLPGKATLNLDIPWNEAPTILSADNAVLEATLRKIPTTRPEWKAQWGRSGEKILLTLTGPAADVKNASYYPFSDSVITHAAEQSFRGNRNQLSLELSPSTLTSLSDIQDSDLSGVVVLSSGEAFEIAPVLASLKTGIWEALLFAFLGGLILNLMPCVFPVLSLKVLSFAGMSGSSRKKNLDHAFSYALGILVSFWILAGALIALRAGGQKLGWGFQLQSPLFLALLSFLLVAMALNLFGLFEFGSRLSGAGQTLAGKEGRAGAFFSGVLATLVATPCTAPFMGSAMGFALAQPAMLALLVFSLLAIGMATPFVFFAFFPRLTAFLPRPGLWMVRFKQLMAFPLLLTAWWLLSVLALQTTVHAVFQTLLGLMGFSLGLWIWGISTGKHFFLKAVALFILGGSVFWAVQEVRNAPAPSNSLVSDGIWQPYSEKATAEALAQKQAVFIDFTAAWCITCQVNERVALNIPDVQAVFKEKKVLLLKADWTHQDAAIAQTLEKFGRSGVPLYLLYPPGEGTPRILPQILTPQIVKSALDW